MASGQGSGGDPKVVAAVDEALDDLLGPVPTELVEERPALRDAGAEDEAMASVQRLRQRGYGLP